MRHDSERPALSDYDNELPRDDMALRRRQHVRWYAAAVAVVLLVVLIVQVLR
jgi:hypothetical protein